MKVGMSVRVLPARRGMRHPSYLAEVVTLPTLRRGKARVRFRGGATASVPLWRLIKP